MRQPEKAAIRVPVLVRSCVVWSKRNANEPPGGLFTLHTSRQSAASAHLIRSLFVQLTETCYTFSLPLIFFTYLNYYFVLRSVHVRSAISDLSGDRTGVRVSVYR